MTMTWYHYVVCFFARPFVANVMPQTHNRMQARSLTQWGGASSINVSTCSHGHRVDSDFTRQNEIGTNLATNSDEQFA